MAAVLDRPSEAAGWLEAAEALLVRLRAIFFVENDRLGLVGVSQVWLMTPCRWSDLVVQIFTVKILVDGLLKYGLNLNIDGPA